jgi:hypothetical protein
VVRVDLGGVLDALCVGRGERGVTAAAAAAAAATAGRVAHDARLDDLDSHVAPLHLVPGTVH